MQINHNIRAMVTQHALFQNNTSMSKSLEKLSTGLRINRAQDDAAGLAMSEQMRTQIRGLGKAKENALNGQAALQIAEGGLAEITNLMQRQRELAIQSANDTLTSTERKYLDDEFQALTREIGRIASTTDYNGKNMLNYNADPNKSFGAVKFKDADAVAATGGSATRTDGGAEEKATFKMALPTGTFSIGSTTFGKSTADGTNGKWNNAAELAFLMQQAGVGGDDWDIKQDGTSIAFVKKEDGKYAPDKTTEADTISAFKTELSLGSAVNVTMENRGKSSGGTWSITPPGKGEQLDINLSDIKDGDAFKIGATINITYSSTGTAGTWVVTSKSDLAAKLTTALNGVFEGDFSVEISGDKMTITNKAENEEAGDDQVGKAASYTLHVGANYSGMWGPQGRYGNELKVTYEALNCAVTDDGKWTVNVGSVQFMKGDSPNLDITSQNKSTEAIDAIDQAIKVVSGARAQIGTYINRLDYTVNNIANLEFNTQDAESRIRDTDFGKETTNFTRNQIMVQSSVSMLAQANSLPQAVLGLLG